MDGGSGGREPMTEAANPVGRAAPEPARAWAAGLPQRARVRASRLEAAPGRLVLTRGGRGLRSLTVGPGRDVVTAEHLGGRPMRDVAPYSLGAVDLLDAEGGRVARIDLRDWLPEAGELTRSREALERSGVGQLLEHAGLNLRRLPARELAAALSAQPPSLAPWRRLPVAYTVLRSVAAAVAAVALIWAIMTGDSPVVLWAAGAFGLLLSTLAALGLWAVAAWVDRIPEDGAPTLRPHPGVPASRRFRRVARLRLEPDDAVLIDALGRERRLPRTGRHGITVAAVVRDGGPTAQLELRTADGIPRATLPWKYWFAGADGAESLKRICAEAGLRLQRAAAPAVRPDVEEKAARAIFAPPARDVLASTIWPKGLPGQAAVWQTAPFAAALLPYAPESRVTGAAQIGLAVTVLLTAVLQWGRLLIRRLWLDRPGEAD